MGCHRKPDLSVGEAMLRVSYARWEAIEASSEDAAIPDGNGANLCGGIFGPASNVRCENQEALIPVLGRPWRAKIVH